MNGIDVSYVQKNVDWQKVKKAGIEFAFARIGYGKELSQKDAMFEKHYAAAKAVGILLGGYHYSYAVDTEGAMREAKACLAMLNGKTFDLPIAYDMEEAKQFSLSPEKLYSIYKTFANIIEAEGYKCILYTNKNWMVNKWDKTTISKDDIPIWMAQYNRILSYTGPCKIYIWQNSSSANIDGISGRVDTNIMLEDMSTLIQNKATWIQEGTRWWYRHEDGGYTKNNWEKIDGKWYFFDGSGYMVTGWINKDEKWYYLKPDGSMAENEILTISSSYGDEKYAFSTDGHMLRTNGRGALV